MALTSTTTFDLIGQTQMIQFNNSGVVDQISYGNGQVTFAEISGFNLSKSDLILYNQYLQVFNTLLLVNFPLVAQNIGQVWPLCNFQISETTSGVTHIVYNQTSQGNTVENINYVPIAASEGFTARGAPITIMIQEYFMFVLMMGQFAQQVNLN